MVETKVLYEELTPKEFRARLAEAPIAYLPLGTLEWHGEHLPLGSDGLQSQGFFMELARFAGGIVLPMLFLGPDGREEVGGREYYGMDIIGHPEGQPAQLDGSAYWIDNDGFGLVLEAVLKQLKRAGFRIVVAHGHGPSTFFVKAHIDEWREKFGLEVFICWREDESDGLGVQTDHAAANETSIMMALHPDLVQMENLPEDRNESLLAVGGQDPRDHASPDRGATIIENQIQRMADLLRERLAEQTG